ncbi:hypothetical protein [Citrobacter amalonaticus]|uniref:hypothetical protein n=2 Tax=Enterobacteriaceae TaxID=543 RepID=UPI0018AC10DC|nr:hypothetical protein [Citrobacter amalonaticus]
MDLQQNKFAGLQFTLGSLNYSPVIKKYFFLNLDEFKLSKTKCIAKDELPHCFPFAL